MNKVEYRCKECEVEFSVESRNKEPSFCPGCGGTSIRGLEPIKVL